MAKGIQEELGIDNVNVADGDLPQYTAALGCAILGHIRLNRIGDDAKAEKAKKAA
jgi:hypothetical protein